MPLFILLFLLVSHITTVTMNAGCHSDRDTDHRPRQNCTAAGFSSIPAGLEPSTQVLVFANNLFSSLTWSSFQIFTEIYEIDLTGNKVSQVTPSVSPILPSLSVLRLGSNHLTSLSNGSFSACPGLTGLYLENNAIDSLSNHTFSGLSKLKVLDLSSNRIKILPQLLLHPLLLLDTLNLENNKIKLMPEGWFIREWVPYLFLSGNLWVCSCSLDYLHNYLVEYDFNVYYREGKILMNDATSVVCDSPLRYKGKPVILLNQTDLCPTPTQSAPRGDFYQLKMTNTLYKTTTSATTVPSTITASSPPATTVPTSAGTPALIELHTDLYTRVVTWSWYQSFTSFFDDAVSSVSRNMPWVEPHTSVAKQIFSTIQTSTERPANKMTSTPTKLARATKSARSAVTLATQKLQVVATTATVPSGEINRVGELQMDDTGAVRGPGVFCFWLFAGCLLLCLVSTVCILVTLTRLLVWYGTVYKPLKASLLRKGGSEGMRLLTHNRWEEEEVAGGAMALYRSVLFIQKEGEAMEKEDEGREGGEGERLFITLEPAGGGAMREEEGQGRRREKSGVSRKTVDRLMSKEQEIESWRDVIEECRVSAKDGSREVKDEGMDRVRSGGGVYKKYIIILKEEKKDAGEKGEELEWVVGGWEVKRGGGEEEPGSSWGGIPGPILAPYTLGSDHAS